MDPLNLTFSMSMGGNESMVLGDTYRDEGLSINISKLRFFGEDVPLEVNYEDLIFGQRIGQGACSSVNLARHRRTNQMYAIKFFNILDKNQASQLYNEIYTLANFQCDALISLKGVFHLQGCIGLILEYMDLGSLEGLIQYTNKGNLIPEEVLASIAFQALWGLCYLNYENQIHRDIKPANILMSSNGSIKISDFGISRDLGGSELLCQSAVGSFRYMSLERLEGSKYDSSADVWSIAITLLEIWNGHYPFRSYETPINLLMEIQETDLESLLRESKIKPSKLMIDFFMDMLIKSYKKRFKATELITSNWFRALKIHSLEDAQSIFYGFLNNSTKYYHNEDIYNYLNKSVKFIPSNNPNMNMSMSFGGYESKVSLNESMQIMKDVFESSMDRFNQSMNKSLVNNPFHLSLNNSMSFNNNYNNRGPVRGNDRDYKRGLRDDDDEFFNAVKDHHQDDYSDDFESENEYK